MNELANVEKKEVSEIIESAKSYLNSLGNNLSDKYKEQFINIAVLYKLNPLKREIYGIPYKDKFNIVVGYEVYLKRANRTGKLAGWKVWTEGDAKDGTLKGCIEIRRKDWDEPFYHEVDYNEYNQGNHMWQSKPKTMIKKVAIAQGFRLAFPDEFDGLPYTQEEIGMNSEIEPEVVVETVDTESKPEKELTIEYIKKVVKPELADIFRNKRMTSSQIIEVWKKYNGNQDEMIKELGGKSEENKVA